MSDLTNVRWTIESDAFGATPATVGRATIYEALGEPYGAELRVTIGDPDYDPAAALGKDVVLTLDRGDSVLRRLCGIVREVVEAGETRPDTTDLTLVVVPALWMLSRRRNTKIFQEMTTVEILEAVLNESLGPYERSIRDELRASDYPKREYCVQYQETDLDFVHRLMEEDGIYYWFDHEGDTEVLVLMDTNESAAAVEAPDGGLVDFVPTNQVIRAKEPVHLVQRRHEATTTSVVIGDWDWTRATMPFSVEQRGTDVAGRDRESYEHGRGRSLQITDYSPRAYGKQDGERQKKIRHQAHVRDTVTIEGVGRVIGFAPGQRFHLGGHPTLGMDGDYMVVRVIHRSESPADLVGGAGATDDDPYHNRFECVPVDAEFRLDRRTPKPRVTGIQTAVVTGPSGEEIHVDEHGRIKVQFHWDRAGQHDEHTTCWIRVEQPWSGAGWGFWYVPRIGMEVVVQFVDGDPDRPMVTGCVYNASNLTPYALPDDKTKSTIKSNSSIGGGGFNEFRFEDAKGSEQIFTHAQKDYDEVVENDHTTLVHHDQSNTVDNDQTQEIHRHQKEMVHGDQRMTVDGDRTVLVKSDFDETVDGTETRHVKGDVEETFDANETRAITGDLKEDIVGDETRTIGGNHDETVTGSHSQTITGSSTESTTGSLSQTVVAGITTTTPASYDITAVGGFSVTAGAAIALTVPGGAQVVSPGGVSHVDQGDSWFGGSVFEASLFASSIYPMKMELCGVALGDTMLKAAAVGMQVETAQIKNETDTTKIKAGGVALWKRLKFDLTSWKNEG